MKANAHNCRNVSEEQHVYCQEQGGHALNFQQAGFEGAVQEYDQAVCGEVHVALAQATDMPRAEVRERTSALENQAEQTWTSHQIMFLNEMNGAAGDALDNQRRSLLNDATAELQRHQRQNHQHLQEYQQGLRRHLSEGSQVVQIHQVATREEVAILRRELSQSFSEGSHYQNVFTTSRSGASESSSAIQ